MLHLAPLLGGYTGKATDSYVLATAARHACFDCGGNITVGKYTLAEETGCSDRTVWASMRRLREHGVLERTAQRTAERGGDVHRLACQRCYPDTAAKACQRCSSPTADRPTPDHASGVETTPELKELQNRRSASEEKKIVRPTPTAFSNPRVARRLVAVGDHSPETCGWDDCYACPAVVSFEAKWQAGEVKPVRGVTSAWWESADADAFYAQGVKPPPACHHSDDLPAWPSVPDIRLRAS
jgi:hypothetical protein